jgi:hypothetical protein
MKINNTNIDGETLWTDITYTLKDGTEITTKVAHFQPQNEEEVLINILNRKVSEQAKYSAKAKNEEIKVELDKIEGQQLEVVDGKIAIKK